MSRLDADGDGAVTEAEFAAAGPPERGAGPPDGMPPPGMPAESDLDGSLLAALFGEDEEEESALGLQNLQA